MKLHSIAFTLVVIGGINSGLMALGSYMGNSWDVINLVLGSWPAVVTLLYLLVGISAIILMFSHKMDCRECAV